MRFFYYFFLAVVFRTVYMALGVHAFGMQWDEAELSGTVATTAFMAYVAQRDARRKSVPRDNGNGREKR
jgi:hypothetical protein